MEFFNQASISNLPTDQGDIAMSRGQARQLIDRFAQEALRKNITPDAFQTGIFELSVLGNSPDYSRRLIRNTLKSPAGRFAINNPGTASKLMGRFTEGVNPALAGKHMGLITDVLKEAKKDNLFRPDVTLEETKKEIQPLNVLPPASMVEIASVNQNPSSSIVNFQDLFVQKKYDELVNKFEKEFDPAIGGNVITRYKKPIYYLDFNNTNNID